MSLAALMTMDVSILTPGSTTDRYGNSVKDWSTATTQATKAWVSQRSAAEDRNYREGLVSDWVAYLPSDVTVTGLQRITWGALTFDVVGEPLPAYRPQTGLHHYEVDLRLVTG